MNIVKIEGERLTKYSSIRILLNPPYTDQLYTIPYHDVLKLQCTNGYIKYLTYITKERIYTIPGEHVFDILY